MSPLFEQLQIHLDKAYAYRTALVLLSWDNSTLAPKKAMANTSKAVAILSGERYKALINQEVKDLLNALTTKEEQEKLTFYEKAIVKNVKKQFEDLELIPAEEYQEYQLLLAKSKQAWEYAKANNDYPSFAPVLKDIIAYTKKFASYKQKEGQPLYDVQLDDYAEGFTTEILDDFFGKLRTELVPLVHKIKEKKNFVSRDCLRKNYDMDTQKKMARFLSEYVGFDMDRGVIAESMHPFTTNLHNHDVRLTSFYRENKLEYAIFCVIHETGHALYEQDIDDEITLTPIGGGAGMSMHESQSRLYENNFGRSRAFWKNLYVKVQEFFPEQLGAVSLEEFYGAINYSEPGLIRTAADELTYPFHIMIRYEIEKMIFEQDVDVMELPKIWNQKYEEYLGVIPSNDSEGILQDVHWSGGMLGYFPSYALGSAIAAQLYHHMDKEMPLETYLEEGNLKPIQDYLKEHIHRFGESKNTQELLLETTGETFKPDYYVEYLTKKYSDLYELN